ncbi:hybrid sensor histidine kinase/response regulator [Profundibacterium mesophilum]|uniref:hybrid sensor histidine kinase/response regulator n=1 Tax=Profundibacterium mesophilum TaxID=1258573 RepID=UPI00135CD07C|nr:ATP-binding protein [Profundibacterium mesophilum]
MREWVAGLGKKAPLRHAGAIGLTAAIGALALLCIHLFDRIGALRALPYDNLQWSLSQLEVDHLRMLLSLEQLEDDESDVEAFRKAYDIFYSRVTLISNGSAAADVHLDPALHHQHELLRSFLRNTVEIIDGSDAAFLARLPEFKTELARVSEVPRRLSLSAVEMSARMSDADRAEIVRLLKSTGAFGAIVLLALSAAYLFLRRQRGELNRRARRLEQAGEMRDSILRASLDAIIVLDAKGIVCDFNGSAEKIFGFSREEVIGRPMGESLVPARFRAAHAKGLATYESRDTSAIVDKGRIELTALHAEGHELPIELSISETSGQNGPLFVSYIRDITDIRRAQAELQEARDKAISANRAKSRFFAIMSHEMRTPLNGIVSSLELLRTEPLNETQLNFLRIAESSSEVLLSHIDDVLDIEKINAGNTNQPPVRITMEHFVPALLDGMRPAAQAQDTEVNWSVTGDTAPLMAPPRMLQQILTNLVSNAIKFTSGGHVRVDTRMSRMEDDLCRLVLSISDTGTGIAEKAQETIFDDFISADSPYERSSTGTGLGLGIVRRLVERLDGTVRCESEAGKGSTFTVELVLPYSGPRELVIAPSDPGGDHDCPDDDAQAGLVFADAPRSATLPAAVAPSPQLPTDGRIVPMRILVVDDDANNRELLDIRLRREGHMVSLASDGFEAVHLASKSRFDLILMDISLPNMSGTRATREIRASRAMSRQAPIYAVTAHAMPEEIREFEAAGMAGCLIKPIRARELHSLLAEITPQNAPGESGPAPQDHCVPTLDHECLTALETLLGADNRTERLSVFLLEGNHSLQQIGAAAEARDFQTLAALSHRFAGACATFGAAAMNSLLGAVEQQAKSGQKARELGDLGECWAITLDAYSNGAHIAAKGTNRPPVHAKV